MDDSTKLAIIDEILEYDGVPMRGSCMFTLKEYRKRHKKKYGYELPESTARDRLAVKVEKGILKTDTRHVVTEDGEDDVNVWWKPQEEERHGV